MKKANVLLLILLLFASCKDNEIEKTATPEDKIVNVDNLTIKGKITVTDQGISVFTVQLISGNVDNSSFDNDYYILPESQVYMTGQDNIFHFDSLKEGSYTLRVTKKGYKPVNKYIEVKKESMDSIEVSMIQDRNVGLTGRVQILSEDGQEISELKFPRNTFSVFCLLFNGKGTPVSWNASKGYCSVETMYMLEYKSGTVERVRYKSDWIQEVKPSLGALNPNEIAIIEVVLDPKIYYLTEEHSSCKLSISIFPSEIQTLTLSY